MPLNNPRQNDHNISLDQAIELVTSFRKALPSILQQSYQTALPFSETFDKSVFETLLKQPGAVGIRSYLGLDEKKQVRLIFVATNEKNEDILPDGTTEGAIFEYGQRCPPICGVNSPLNPEV